EDGIRDFHVTGVQTCALPISVPLPASYIILSEKPVCLSPFPDMLPIAKHHNIMKKWRGWHHPKENGSPVHLNLKLQHHPHLNFRSEERRVGKECRSRCTR